MALVVAALGMVTTAATWVFGPYGLAAVGVALLVVALFIVEVEG